MKSLIGIYTRPSDDHLGRVVQELQRRHLPYVRFDTQDFPQVLRLAATISSHTSQGWHGAFTLSGKTYRLEDVRSIWYRRPSRSYSFPTLSADGYAFARAEAQKGFGGVLSGLSTRWVSHPDTIRAAEWKPIQLASAQRIGLAIPRTLITNEPKLALQFFEECHGEMIYKPFTQGTPQPKVGEPWKGAIYTTKLTKAELDLLAPRIAITAHLFQAYVPKAFELRITIIGARVFAAEIHSQHSEQSRIDFRMGYQDLRYHIHQLPPSIEQACKTLVDLFGLRFAAIDMIVTPEQEYVFLEINANGQWGWIEQMTGLPLTAALVDLLAQENEDA